MGEHRDPSSESWRRPVGRRAVLASAAGLGIAGIAAASFVEGSASGQEALPAIAPFAGGHQSGITTARQSDTVLAAFDLRTSDPTRLASLLQAWTGAITAMAAGRPVSGDSGETVGSQPSRLTVTVGVGPGIWQLPLRAPRPAALAALPPFAGDQLDPATSGGDLLVQASADGGVVASHALRQLTRLAAGTLQLRWATTGVAPHQEPGTPRGPLGFKDGTGNPTPGTAAFEDAVWVRGGPNPPWIAGGTYLCFRKIRIDFAAWDGLTAGDQQVVIGRAKASGAPLSGGGEDAPLELTARDSTGNLAIPADSHVRLAAPAVNGGATIFRRSFSYDDGVDQATGRRNAGLLFLAHAADPTTQVVPILRSISGRDRLAQFTTHIASGVWAVLPAPAAGGWLGQGLFT